MTSRLLVQRSGSGSGWKAGSSVVFPLTLALARARGGAMASRSLSSVPFYGHSGSFTSSRRLGAGLPTSSMMKSPMFVGPAGSRSLSTTAASTSTSASSSLAAVDQTLDASSSFLSPLLDPCVSFLLSHPMPTYSSTIILLTLLLRSTITLPTALWARSRMRTFREQVIPRMKKENDRFAVEVARESRRTGKSYEEYKKVLKARLAMRQKELVKQFKCHPIITAVLPAIVHVPLFVLLSFTIRQAVLTTASDAAAAAETSAAATPGTDEQFSSLSDMLSSTISSSSSSAFASPMASESLFWIPSLTDSDPLYILPFAVGVMAFSNVEVMQGFRNYAQRDLEEEARVKAAAAAASEKAASGSAPSRAELSAKISGASLAQAKGQVHASRRNRGKQNQTPTPVNPIQEESASGNMSTSELSAREKAIAQGGMRQRIMSNVLRIVAVASIGVAAELPAAVVLYWLTSTSFSLAQNTVLNAFDKRRLREVSEGGGAAARIIESSPSASTLATTTRPSSSFIASSPASSPTLRVAGSRSFSTSRKISKSEDPLYHNRELMDKTRAQIEEAIPAKLIGSREELEEKKKAALAKYHEKLKARMEKERVGSLEELRKKVAPREKVEKNLLSEALEKQKEKVAAAAAKDASATASAPSPSLKKPKTKSTSNDDQAAADRSGIKPLSKILNLDIVYSHPHTPEAISLLWQHYHSAHPTLSETFLSASIPPSTYASMVAVAKENPSFVIPLPRSDNPEAFEMFYLQWLFHPTRMAPSNLHDEVNRSTARQPTSSVLFTPLAEFKNNSEWAQPHLVLTHYPDLHNNPLQPEEVKPNGEPVHHPLVLMRGEIAPSQNKSSLTSPLPNQDLALTQHQAQLLALAVQRFYCTDVVPPNESESAREERMERKRILEGFRKDPASWDWKPLVKLAYAGVV